MRYFIIPAVLLLSIVLIATASASDIYKWTDAEGNVNYTDKPISPQSVRLDIVSRPTNNASVQAQVQTRLGRKAAAAEAAANRPSEPTAEELRAEARTQSEKCNIYKERMTRFSQSRHLYREGDDGERVYLGPVETKKVRAKAEDQVKEYCNS